MTRKAASPSGDTSVGAEREARLPATAELHTGPTDADPAVAGGPNRRQRMCSGCPFNPDRDWPKISADVMATIEARIADGEAWICHQTCDGARVTPRSLLCAGTP